MALVLDDLSGSLTTVVLRCVLPCPTLLCCLPFYSILPYPTIRHSSIVKKKMDLEWVVSSPLLGTWS